MWSWTKKGDREVPPNSIFFKWRRQSKLSTPLLFFDNFRQDSLFAGAGFYNKALNGRSWARGRLKLSVGPHKYHKKSLLLVYKWHNIRAPPQKSEHVLNHIQIFGGKKMNKIKFRKIFVKNFFNVARALPRYHVSLTPESNGKGVSA